MLENSGLLSPKPKTGGQPVGTCQTSLGALRVPAAGTPAVNECRPTSAADLAGAFILALLIMGV